MAFKIHTFLIFIWWYGHFSSLYEWVYKHHLEISYPITNLQINFTYLFSRSNLLQLYIFPIILIIFILIKLYNFIKRVNYVF